LLDRVRDGSTGETEKGSDTFEIAALTENKELPIEIYSRIYSSLEKGFKVKTLKLVKVLILWKNTLEKKYLCLSFLRSYYKKTKITK
jgi:hypothetical protein